MKPILDTIAGAFVSYKTTLGGIALGVLTVYAHGGFAHMTGAEMGQALGLVVLGVLAKDATKTGTP